MYTVAFTGIYAMNFPHMDDLGYMCFKPRLSGKTSGGGNAARNAVEVVAQMRPRLPMALNWAVSAEELAHFNCWRKPSRMLAPLKMKT